MLNNKAEIAVTTTKLSWWAGPLAYGKPYCLVTTIRMVAGCSSSWFCRHAVITRMSMRCYGHGTSQLHVHTSVRSLCDLQYLRPSALGCVNIVETCTLVYNQHIYSLFIRDTHWCRKSLAQPTNHGSYKVLVPSPSPNPNPSANLVPSSTVPLTGNLTNECKWHASCVCSFASQFPARACTLDECARAFVWTYARLLETWQQKCS